MSVVARQGIGAKASLVVVEAEGTRFYLGVTEQSVSVLHSSTAPRALQAVPVSDDAVPTVQAQAAAASAGPGTTAEPADARFAASLRLAATAPGPGSTADAEPVSRRAARAARSAEPAQSAATLQGSILSPATWKQTAAFLRQGRAG
ncbi:hypothetical protein MN0502_05100 [Arthrobacter sp. MN05-02]|nr:hypothetical protein MN0502_05100 [Arthrobacter sp. MN05-02]